MSKTNVFSAKQIEAAADAAHVWGSLSSAEVFAARGGRTIADWEWLLNRCATFNLIAIGGK